MKNTLAGRSLSWKGSRNGSGGNYFNGSTCRWNIITIIITTKTQRGLTPAFLCWVSEFEKTLNGCGLCPPAIVICYLIKS
jgi:hypothetical protein